MINAYFNQAMFFFLGQSKSQFTTLHLIDYASKFACVTVSRQLYNPAMHPSAAHSTKKPEQLTVLV